MVTNSTTRLCLTGYDNGVVGAVVGPYACTGRASQTWTFTTSGELKLATGPCATAVRAVELDDHLARGLQRQRSAAWRTTAEAPLVASGPAGRAGARGGDAGRCTPAAGTSTPKSIVVSSTSSSLTVSQSVSLAARVYNAAGAEILPAPTLAWSSSQPSVLKVDDKGVISALAAGQATVTVSVDGMSGSPTSQLVVHRRRAGDGAGERGRVRVHVVDVAAAECRWGTADHRGGARPERPHADGEDIHLDFERHDRGTPSECRKRLRERTRACRRGRRRDDHGRVRREVGDSRRDGDRRPLRRLRPPR